MGKTKYSAEQIRKKKAEALNKLDMLNGRGKHNTPSNICWGDGYFAASIKREFNCDDLQELERWARS